MKFDSKYEIEVVAKALKDTVFLKKAVRTIKPHHFVNKDLRAFWKVISEAWVSHKEAPTIGYLASRLRAEAVEDDLQTKALLTLRQIYDLKSTDANIKLEDMITMVRQADLQKAMEQALLCMDDNQADDAYDFVKAAIKKDHKARDYDCVSWVEEFDDRQRDRVFRRENPDAFPRIATGIKALDKVLKGGAKLGTFNLVMATTNRGKSIALVNIAYAAARMGVPTVYFSLEMPAIDIASRVDSRWSGIEHDRIVDAELDLDEMMGLEKRNQMISPAFKNNLKIISMALSSCSFSTVEEVLDDLQTEDNFIPKVIILDSADLMVADNRKQDFRLQQKAVYEMGKSKAMEGHVVWTSTQAGREYVDKIATSEASSESYDKSRIADLIVSINSPKSASRSTKTTAAEYSFLGNEFDGGGESPVASADLEMFVAKNRGGPKDMTIPLKTDFSRMYMQSADEEDLEY